MVNLDFTALGIDSTIQDVSTDDINDSNGLDLNPFELDSTSLLNHSVDSQHDNPLPILEQHNSLMELPVSIEKELTLDHGFREQSLHSAAIPVTITNNPLHVEVVKRNPQVNIYDVAEPESEQVNIYDAAEPEPENDMCEINSEDSNSG